MERQFSLIKNRIHEHEKKILPRFPYCYLTFKESSKAHAHHVFEVKDISLSGMQLALRDGSHSFQKGDLLQGHIHWQGQELEVKAQVVWTTTKRLGASFSAEKKWEKAIQQFLSPQSISQHLRPIHKQNLEIVGQEFPANLKYWLRADGPAELFAWCHPDGEFSSIQMILMEHFIEWEDGKGLRTGRVATKRDLDTPLLTEDEFVFLMDEELSEERRSLALQVLEHVSTDLLSPEALDFVKLKLGH